LTLLQFNVMQGATKGRARAVAALIKDLRPDVVTLDEVIFRNIFDQIASSTRMYGYWARANDGYSIGILSRAPLHACTTYHQAQIKHAAYSCRVTVGGTSWWIFGSHLACCGGLGQETIRGRTISLLISKMVHRRLPVVLAGDLNAHTPGERDAPPRMLVIPDLLEAGFIDSFRELHSLAQDPGFTVTAPPYGTWDARLDYVFHSKGVRAISARVISNVHGYRWPSDHAALLVTLAALRSHS
jgi:endonuclease/exonuclease/phosphatase (EEP) superfamily protein YafD